MKTTNESKIYLSILKCSQGNAAFANYSIGTDTSQEAPGVQTLFLIHPQNLFQEKKKVLIEHCQHSG